MRTLTSFSAILACLLGMASAAQAVSLTMSSDKAIYAFGETITITVVGDPQGATAIGVFGTIDYDPVLVSADGGQTQTALSAPPTWLRGGLSVDIPNPNTQDSFSQIASLGTIPRSSTVKMTATMSFTAGAHSSDLEKRL